MKYATVSRFDQVAPVRAARAAQGFELVGVLDSPAYREESDILDYTSTAVKRSLEEHGMAVLYFESYRPECDGHETRVPYETAYCDGSCKL